jgi:type II secretory pathway pseudopilin PulG
MRRRGFMLIELLIAITLVTILAAIAVALVLALSHTAQRATQRLAATRTGTTLALLLTHELADAASIDVTAASRTRLRFARAIGQTFLCGDSATAVFLPVAGWTGTRAPEAGRDRVILLSDPAAATWIAVPIATVDARTCPGTAMAAWRVGTPVHTPGAVVTRIDEPVEMSVYRSGSVDWLGLSPFPVTASVQPFAGPLPLGTASLGLSGNWLAVSLQLAGVPLSSLGIPLAPAP